MATPKKFFHDHWVLLLLSVNAFLALAVAIYTSTSLLARQSTTYFVQCRKCGSDDIDQFIVGNITGLLSFIVISVIIMAVHTVLAKRTYKLRRSFSLTILWLGVLLQILSLLIIYSLLSSQN